MAPFSHWGIDYRSRSIRLTGEVQILDYPKKRGVRHAVKTPDFWPAPESLTLYRTRNGGTPVLGDSEQGINKSNR